MLTNTPNAAKGIGHYKGKGASIPLLTKPNLEPKYHKAGRTGDSNVSGVSSGPQAGTIDSPRGVMDPSIKPPAPIDEYNFGPHIENIKSYYNTLDFENGAGPLAMINKDLDKLLT